LDVAILVTGHEPDGDPEVSARDEDLERRGRPHEQEHRQQEREQRAEHRPIAVKCRPVVRDEREGEERLQRLFCFVERRPVQAELHGQVLAAHVLLFARQEGMGGQILV